MARSPHRRATARLGVAIALAAACSTAVAVPSVPAGRASAADAGAGSGGDPAAAGADPAASAAPSGFGPRGLVADLQERITGLAGEVETLSAERDRLASGLDRLLALAPSMEADRLLLTELRKETPEDRAEAEAWIARLRDLALTADPAGLGLPATRLAEAAPDYLDWREATFGSPAEASDALDTGGAANFETRLGEFRDAVLLTVANRIDGILNVLDRAR